MDGWMGKHLPRKGFAEGLWRVGRGEGVVGGNMDGVY